LADDVLKKAGRWDEKEMNRLSTEKDKLLKVCCFSLCFFACLSSEFSVLTFLPFFWLFFDNTGVADLGPPSSRRRRRNQLCFQGSFVVFFLAPFLIFSSIFLLLLRFFFCFVLQLTGLNKRLQYVEAAMKINKSKLEKEQKELKVVEAELAKKEPQLADLKEAVDKKVRVVSLLFSRVCLTTGLAAFFDGAVGC
jgi:hypothetical protein